MEKAEEHRQGLGRGLGWREGTNLKNGFVKNGEMRLAGRMFRGFASKPLGNLDLRPVARLESGHRWTRGADCLYLFSGTRWGLLQVIVLECGVAVPTCIRESMHPSSARPGGKKTANDAGDQIHPNHWIVKSEYEIMASHNHPAHSPALSGQPYEQNQKLGWIELYA